MEYVYASLLIHKAGKEVTEDSLKKVLEAAGIQADEIRVKATVAALKNINIDEVLKSATALQAAPTVAAAPQAKAEEAPKLAEKKEEEKEEKEEEAAEGLGALFG